MKFFSSTIRDTVLREQLKQLHRNLLPEILAFTLVVVLAAGLVYRWSGDTRVVLWASIIVLLNCFGIARAFIYRNDALTKPGLIGVWETIMAIVNGTLFALLPLMVVPDATPEITMWIVFACTGLAAGSIATQSSWLPVFLGFNITQMCALAYALYHRDEPVYQGLAVGVMLLLVTLSLFALNLQSTIRQAIILRFENDGLIHKLRSALTQTDEANRAKSVFLASASHDLRQPLHALGLLTETIGGTSLNSQQSEIQQHMMSAIDSTRTMLDSLLNISKLDAGAISSEPKPFLVQSLFSKLEAELAPTADEHDLIYRTRETIAAAHSDPFIVELILRNLIANAIRYTTKGGLLVACRTRPRDALLIEVWDTGIGIAPDKLNDIFREFNQLDNPERDAHKGFGLGLAIAQGLAKTIDSEIQVSSVLGRGTVFRFALPYSTAEIIEDLPRHNRAVDFSGAKVLVIDDDARIRASMRALIQTWGCTCLDAESAIEAIELVGEQPIDLLLVDYRLREGRTGREAIHDLRLHLGHHVPAIIITGDTGTERIIEAQSADALLLHKPASATQLQRMMQTLLKTQTPRH
ncbi:ATP-binding response regulator [Arenicella xantha]|uniref:histidine kinase n=1 Tax=Arenicella xantha TaxID=644221 RepID=A0A395JHM3_9GAMM|nr:hybrid sensor histidine kinase/response regulator [Arenicella xantha]RBP49079.1 signal transduction histidine kinase [Arenicella xantha]